MTEQTSSERSGNQVPTMGRFGVPVRGGAIQYRRAESGRLVAEVYGLSPRPFRINVVRSVDGPGWLLEPSYVYLGIEQDAARAHLFLDGYVGSRDPQPSLRDVRELLHEIWLEWIRRTRGDEHPHLKGVGS